MLKIIHQNRFAFACIFFACVFGVLLRSVAFYIPHGEGDERIYLTLVDQLLSGKGYTLQGSELLSSGEIESSHYNQPLFFHPPFGVFLFTVFVSLFGAQGAIFAQFFCYLVFVSGMIFIAKSLIEEMTRLHWLVLGILVALQPIFAHTGIKIWIDNPRMATMTLGLGLLLWGQRHKSERIRKIGAWSVGLALLTKVDTLISLPVFLALDYFLWCSPLDFNVTHLKKYFLENKGNFLRALTPIGVWMVFSLIETGGIFSGSPGRPSSELINGNPFIHYVTVVLPSYFYIYAFPATVSTCVAGLACVLLNRSEIQLKDKQLLAIVWGGILLQIAVYSFLGAIGYSKLLRYISQTIPLGIVAALIPLSLVVGERRLEFRSVRWYAVVLLYALGLSREVMHGIKVMLLVPQSALIEPFLF